MAQFTISTTQQSCDMSKDCTNNVTHIGSKGYVYCSSCAPLRQRFERTRKMQVWELKLIASGEPLPSYEPILKPKTS